MTGAADDPEPRRAGAGAGKRVVGIDLGERRIGVSVSDTRRVLASPHSVIQRCGEQAVDNRAIAAVVWELDAGLVVVGLPLSLSGHRGPAAQAAVAEAAALESELGVPVVLHDERLTTVEADRRRRLPSEPLRGEGGERGHPRARSPRRSQANFGARAGGRIGIDALAATVLLQSWLDQKRAES
ncbi:MAG: Holliday junction resolvase RuvX [Acidimicrobiales bacterium]